MEQNKPIRVLVVGCGHMGTSHALAYHRSKTFTIVGLVSRGEQSRYRLSTLLGKSYPTFDNYEKALNETRPDAVCINTYPDTHFPYAKLALQKKCHVFLEKPLATTYEEGKALIQLSRENNRKLLVGYILQHHPSWNRFIEESHKLGKPLVMRMNLNQQSSGPEWETHRKIMESMDPMVDCGVHYVDVMCRMTKAPPRTVNAIAARLDDSLPPGRCNYGQLQITFDDGSVGWYEAGWGPMMSQTAFFVKDVVGPLGCISIASRSSEICPSDNVNAHTNAEAFIIHSAQLDDSGGFATEDRILAMPNEPDHDDLCAREQAYFAQAIHEDIDLSSHLESVLSSLQIVLAAKESAQTGQTIYLQTPEDSH